MPGRHASADPSRFRRDLGRLILLVLMSVAVAVAVILTIRFVLSGSGEPDQTVTTVRTVEPVPSTAPITTVASLPTTTVVVVTTTIPPVAGTEPETTTTTVPVREPAQLTVKVLNSTRISGLAGRLTERLSGLGYRTLNPGNHPTALQTSVVRYVEGFDREAEVLAEEIPDATVEPFPGDDPQAPLTVILGASYRE